MSKFFRKLPLAGKLTLIAILPLLFVIYLAVQLYFEKNRKLEILQEYNEKIATSALISNLVDDLQSERRYAFGYVVKNDWQSQLLVQRQKTDESYALLRDTGYENLQNFSSYTMLNRLENVRERVDHHQITPEEVMEYYSNAILKLNNLNTVTAGAVIYLQPVRKELAGQKLLSELVTYMGILRANVYYGLYKKQPTSEIIAQLRSQYDIYNSFQTEFLLKSSPASIEKYNDIKNKDDLKATLTYFDDLFSKGRSDSTFTDEEWWKVSARAVDKIKVLQQSLLKQVKDSVTEIYNNEIRSRDTTVLFLVLVLLLVSFIVAATITSITNRLQEIKEAAQLISMGKTGVKIKVESNDAIGSLANSILKVDANNTVLAGAAEQIGKGNFNIVITPRSEQDILGTSLKKMEQELRKFNKENKEKLWVHAGIEAVNNSIAGEKDLKSLGNDVLDALISYIGAQVGLFYSLQNEHLEYVAGYALPDVNAVPHSIELGERLAGQAAIKKEIIHLQNIPDDYISIASASGNAKPKNVLIVPLVHDGMVEGVIEIGSFAAFDEVVLSLVEQVKSNITVAAEGSKNRARLQELLEETQTQTEELQTQHSELENINSELEAQTLKLQASEEELRVQQEELMQANQELEERAKLLEERNILIVERNLEIQHKAEQLELSTKYKSEFLANMSHELRTPLNSILLLSRLLAENTSDNLSGEQVEYAQVIQSSGNGLLTLIDEILDLSKIEAGKMELEYSDTAVASVVTDLKSLFAPIAKEKNIAFSIEVAPGVPKSIESDKMRLEQVLKNLVSNALKFTSKGSVSINIYPVPEKDSFIAFEVNDTGIGIAKDKQQLVFEAFSQEDGSTRRRFGGTGLGLSISRELTKLLGGEIKVSSEAGKGSSFTIHIPVAKPVPSAVKKDNADSVPVLAEPLPLTKAESEETLAGKYTVSLIPKSVGDDRSNIAKKDKTILIVEDDTHFAKALLDYTRNKGYKGLVAVRGDEGIEMAKQYRPTGILLDIQLPVKDGWQVMEELKTNPHTRHIPVHIMSSNSFKRESLQKGAIDFINKPVALDQMQEVFKKIEQVVTKQGKKVLIVEENTQHAKALAYFLETFNVTSEISSDISQGVTALKRKDVDCVILDMGIPGENAYETLEAVKKNPGLENLPIIIFTGKNLSQPEQQKIKQYADSIVIKTAYSYQRILDEVSLFLHLVEEGNQTEKQAGKYRKLGVLSEVLSHKTILIADDDVRNIFSLSKALEQHDMKVLTAVDGKEALKQLEENTDVDIVLMDIMMPEMDGYETTRRIRQHYKYKNLPVIAVTAKAMTGDREKCIQAGASDYISKPVDIDQLLSLLRVWLYEKGG